MFTILRPLIFFPSITFSLIRAEIFPWALMYVAGKAKNPGGRIWLFMMLLTISGLITAIVLSNIDYIEIVRSIAAYLNPILIFVYLLRARYSEIAKFLVVQRAAFYVMVIIGMLQLFGLLKPLEPFLQLLVARAFGTTLGEEGRGVGLLASEPSRAADEFMFMYLCYRWTANLAENKKILSDILCGCYMLFVIKSGVGLFLFGLFMACMYPSVFLIGILILFFFVAVIDTESSRAIWILYQLLTSESLDGAYLFLVDHSGVRFTSAISAYYYGLAYPWGHGVGNWMRSSVEAFYFAGFTPDMINVFRTDNEFVPIRPNSYIASLVLDLGAIGLLALVSCLVRPIISAWALGREMMVFSVVFLFYLMFVGAVGNPVQWACFAIALRYGLARHRKDNQSTQDRLIDKPLIA